MQLGARGVTGNHGDKRFPAACCCSTTIAGNTLQPWEGEVLCKEPQLTHGSVPTDCSGEHQDPPREQQDPQRDLQRVFGGVLKENGAATAGTGRARAQRGCWGAGSEIDSDGVRGNGFTLTQGRMR